jgi:hypothetical protein
MQAPISRKSTEYIVVHHSVTPHEEPLSAAVARIRRSHVSNGLAYDGNPAYHVIVATDGIALVRPENSMGYHAGNYRINQRSLAICLVGNFSTGMPTEYQKKKLALQIHHWQKQYKVSRSAVLLHRQIKATQCPGNHIADPKWLSDILERYKPEDEPWQKILPLVNKAIRERNDEPTRMILPGKTLSSFWQEWVMSGKVSTYQELIDDIKGRQDNKEFPHNQN